MTKHTAIRHTPQRQGRQWIVTAMMALLALGGLLASCSSDDEPVPVTVTVAALPVNYANLAGHWQLITYNGHRLGEDTYLYITFERRDHVFQMYDNMQSMYGQRRTGTYALATDKDSGVTTISGTYDHGVGEWNHEYSVMLTATQLVLTTTDAPHETNVYGRVGALPENVKK